MNRNKQAFLRILFIVISVFFTVIQVILLNFDSTTGTKMSKLSLNLNKLEIENSILGQKIASASAIATISLKAKELGYTTSQKLISINDTLPIAFSSEKTL